MLLILKASNSHSHINLTKKLQAKNIVYKTIFCYDIVPDSKVLHKISAELDKFSHIVFTSPIVVEIVSNYLMTSHTDHNLTTKQLIAVGDKTADTIKHFFPNIDNPVIYPLQDIGLSALNLHLKQHFLRKPNNVHFAIIQGPTNQANFFDYPYESFICYKKIDQFSQSLSWQSDIITSEQILIFSSAIALLFINYVDHHYQESFKTIIYGKKMLAIHSNIANRLLAAGFINVQLVSPKDFGLGII